MQDRLCTDHLSPSSYVQVKYVATAQELYIIQQRDGISFKNRTMIVILHTSGVINLEVPGLQAKIELRQDCIYRIPGMGILFTGKDGEAWALMLIISYQ